MAVKTFLMKKNVGPHHMRVDGKERLLMPGDQITIEEELLGNASDKFDVIAGSEEPEPEEPQDIRKEVVPCKTGGGYDVINAVTRKPINTVPLSRRVAYETAGIEDPGEEPEKKEPEKKEKKEKKEPEKDKEK